MKVPEFERIVTKLGMETRDSRDRLAWLVHDGVTVVRTRRSHGKGKYMPEHLVQAQEAGGSAGSLKKQWQWIVVSA